MVYFIQYQERSFMTYRIEISHKGSTIVDLVFFNSRADLAEKVKESWKTSGATVIITRQ